MYAERLLLQALVLAVAAELRPVSRRRAYGTGSLFARRTARGEETWYGQFWLGGRQVRRALGPKRSPGSTQGLTRSQAERKLRQLIEATRPLPPERLTVEEAGQGLVTTSKTSAASARHLLPTSHACGCTSCLSSGRARFTG